MRRRPIPQRRPVVTNPLTHRSGMDPSLKAALFILPVIVIIDVVYMLVEGNVQWVMYFLRCLFYGVAGFLAASFYRDVMVRGPWRGGGDFVPKGAAAGLICSIFGWLVFLVILLVVNLIEIETTLPGVITILLYAMIDIFLGLFLGAVGGWLGRGS